MASLRTQTLGAVLGAVIHGLAFVVLFLLAANVAVGGEEKPAVPSAEEQKKAQEQIQNVYRASFQKAQTHEAKVALAQKLLDDGIATTDNLTGKFALLRLAGDTAAQQGDVTIAFACADELARDYLMDSLTLKEYWLRGAFKTARAPADFGAFSTTAAQLYQLALVDDRIDLARGIAKLGVEAATKSGNAAALKSAAARAKQIEEIAKQADEIAAAKKVLAEKPTDPAANLTLGKYNCFIKRDWKVGIPYLAQGNDEKLAPIAAKELANGELDSDLFPLAEAWWNVAEKEPETIHAAMRSHALEFYTQALPTLTGLSKAKAETRLKAEPAAPNVAASPQPAPAVKPAPAIKRKPPILYASDVHSGTAGTATFTKANSYTLRVNKPVRIDQTEIRVRAGLERGVARDSNGEILASINGGDFVKIGAWSPDACKEASKNEGWFEPFVLTGDAKATAAEIRIRCEWRSGGYALDFTEVHWVRSQEAPREK